MLSRWLGGFAAIIVTLLTGVLVVLEITDEAMRRWWSGHSLTTDTVSGLLVLLITLLVVDQVVRLRQLNARARAVASQAAIIMTQAERALRSVSQAVAPGAGDSDRDAASGDLRTYMMMLLVGAPVLIDAQVSRNFLEQAQVVGGLMAVSLGVTAKSSGPAASKDARLDDAVQRLRDRFDPAAGGARPGDPGRRARRRIRLTGTQTVTLRQSFRSVAAPPARLPPSLGCYGRVGVEGLGDFEEVVRLQAGIREWLLRTARNGRHELRGVPAPAVLPLLCAAAFGPALAEAARSGRRRGGGQGRGPVLGRGQRTGRCPGRSRGPGAVGAPVRETCRAVTYSGKSAGA